MSGFTHGFRDLYPRDVITTSAGMQEIILDGYLMCFVFEGSLDSQYLGKNSSPRLTASQFFINQWSVSYRLWSEGLRYALTHLEGKNAEKIGLEEGRSSRDQVKKNNACKETTGENGVARKGNGRREGEKWPAVQVRKPYSKKNREKLESES